MSRHQPLTALEAKCCCECKHWRRLGDGALGECRHPERFWGVEYEGGRYVPWWTTGCYATCGEWKGKEAK